jgi:hypothetical protein
VGARDSHGAFRKINQASTIFYPALAGSMNLRKVSKRDHTAIISFLYAQLKTFRRLLLSSGSKIKMPCAIHTGHSEK